MQDTLNYVFQTSQLWYVNVYDARASVRRERVGEGEGEGFFAFEEIRGQETTLRGARVWQPLALCVSKVPSGVKDGGGASCFSFSSRPLAPCRSLWDRSTDLHGSRKPEQT